MINLPKPSQLRYDAEPVEQNNYIIKYLLVLVSALENALSGLNMKSKDKDVSAITNIKYAKNGISIARSDGSEQVISSNNVLWSGAWYMKETQQIMLPKKISELPNGIVLVFSAYADSTPQPYHFQEYFIPKESVRQNTSSGHNFMLSTVDFSYIGTKYLYILDDEIDGNAGNDDTGTSNGVTFANDHWVLRYVIGV